MWQIDVSDSYSNIESDWRDAGSLAMSAHWAKAAGCSKLLAVAPGTLGQRSIAALLPCGPGTHATIAVPHPHWCLLHTTAPIDCGTVQRTCGMGALLLLASRMVCRLLFVRQQVRLLGMSAQLAAGKAGIKDCTGAWPDWRAFSPRHVYVTGPTWCGCCHAPATLMQRRGSEGKTDTAS